MVQPQRAQALLTELEQMPDIRADPYYAAVLPELVRTAFALGDRDLAARLVDGVEPVTPLAQNALAASRAQLAEAAANDAAQGAALYGEAAARWRDFGNVRERAYALLGQGRSLAALGISEAEVPLHEARELFAATGYKPALAKTEALLGEAGRGRRFLATTIGLAGVPECAGMSLEGSSPVSRSQDS